MKSLDKVRQFTATTKTAIKAGVATVVVFGISTASWAATNSSYNVTSVTSEIDKGVAPVAAVSAATISLLVVRRVWKIIRSSI